MQIIDIYAKKMSPYVNAR